MLAALVESTAAAAEAPNAAIWIALIGAISSSIAALFGLLGRRWQNEKSEKVDGTYHAVNDGRMIRIEEAVNHLVSESRETRRDVAEIRGNVKSLQNRVDRVEGQD